MSKTHTAGNQDDIDAALDDYINNSKASPVVTKGDTGIDLFGSGTQKKKSRVQRLLTFLRQLLPIHLQA